MYARRYAGAMALKDLRVLYPFRRCDISPPPITAPEFHDVVYDTGVVGYKAGLCVRFSVVSTAKETYRIDRNRSRTHDFSSKNRNAEAFGASSFTMSVATSVLLLLKI